MLRTFSAFFIFCLSLPWAVAGEELRIPRIEGDIAVDARLDEAAWANALVVELAYETRPGENTPSPMRTECRLMFGSRELYYGCHAFDPEPQSIRARYTDRDRSAPTDDTIGISIDPFDARIRGLIFDVNPLGVQNDRIYSETDGDTDDSWNGIWKSAGRIVEDGYVVEVAIPFSTLSFPRTDEEQTWGINVRRYVPRNVYYRLALMPSDRSNPCLLCQQARVVGIRDVDPGRNLEVTPTVTGVRNTRRQSGSLQSDDPDYDPGLTVNWGITPNLTLAGTVNPDFSQVEADIAQLDINEQFALFFPERRPFFLEGSDFFNTPMRIFQSRSVADPAWGLKLTGKEGRHGIGIYALRDEVSNLLIPGAEGSDFDSLDRETTSSVLRYRMDVGAGSTLGVMATDRSGGEYRNSVIGVDSRFRLGTNHVFDVLAFSSRTEYPVDIALRHDQETGGIDDTAWRFSYAHRPRNWSVRFTYEDVGKDFRADLGFMPQVDYRKAIVGGSYEIFGDSERWFTSIEIGGDWDRAETQSGRFLEEELEAWMGWSGPFQSSLWFGGGTRDRAFRGNEFEQDFAWISGSIRPTGDLRLGLDLSTGDAIDFAGVRAGEQVSVVPEIEYKPGHHLQMTLLHTHRVFDLDAGRLFTADLTELRTIYQINARMFIRAILQYSQVERDPVLSAVEVKPQNEDLFGQLLVAYKHDALTAFYLGYTANYIDLNDQNGLIESGNTLFFKVGYAWQP